MQLQNSIRVCKYSYRSFDRILSISKQILLFFVSALGFLYSGISAALGLGEITLKSSYNEPLSAEIRLIKVKDLDESNIRVELASRDDFRRAGVDRYFLDRLGCEVVLDNQQILISSHIIKNDYRTYLNF